MVRSFRTSISVTKLCNANKAVQECFVHILLSACWRASERINIPSELPAQEHTEVKWATLGKDFAST